MRQHTGPWLAAAFLFTAASASAVEESDITRSMDRFKLWDDCRPVGLLVEDLSEEAIGLGLTVEAIEIAVRSRLRSARLYSENPFWRTYLYINVNVVSVASNIGVGYHKRVTDLSSMEVSLATTWDVGITGTHGGDSIGIMSVVSQQTDRFIDEYLRVNADACE